MTDIINTPFTWGHLTRMTADIVDWLVASKNNTVFTKNMFRRMIGCREILLHLDNHDMSLLWSLDPKSDRDGLDHGTMVIPHFRNHCPVHLLDGDMNDIITGYPLYNVQPSVYTEDVVKALKSFDVTDELLEVCIRTLNGVSIENGRV